VAAASVVRASLILSILRNDAQYAASIGAQFSAPRRGIDKLKHMVRRNRYPPSVPKSFQKSSSALLYPSSVIRTDLALLLGSPR